MTKAKPEQDDYICDVCGWDAKKKSKAKNKERALATHKSHKHGDGEERTDPEKGGTGMETRNRKAKLRGELRRLEIRLRKLPKDIYEMTTVEREQISEFMSALKKSGNPTEDDLDETEREIEDDLKFAINDFENMAKDEKKVEEKDEAGKTDPQDALQKELNREYETMTKEFAMERMRDQMDEMRERRQRRKEGTTTSTSKQQDDGGELKSRTLPDGQIVKMTDKDYTDYSLQYESIKARKKVEKDADKIEFLWDDGKGGKPVSVKATPEEYWRLQQRGGKREDYDEVKKLTEEFRRNEENLRKQIEDQRWNVIGKEISDLKGQVAYNPLKDFMSNMNMLKDGGLMPTEGDSTQLQLLRNQGQFMHDTMQIMGRTSDHSMNIMERAADAYIGGKEEEKKEKIRRKSVLADQGKAPEPPGREELGKLSEKVEENLGERGATGYYFCSKCQGDHAFNSPMGQEHITYREMKSSEKINRKKGKEVGLY